MFGRPKRALPPNTIRGIVGSEPPTPYEYVAAQTGAGVGVSNLAVRRSHAPPVDSYRGRQGVQVLRNLNILEGGSLVGGAQRLSAGVAVNEVHYTTNLVPLFNKR